MLNVREYERTKITKIQTLKMSRSQEKLVQDLSHRLIRDESVQRLEIDDEMNLGGESRSHYPSEVAFDQSGQVNANISNKPQQRSQRKLPQIITAS